MKSRIQDDEDVAVNKDVKVKTNKQQKQLNKTYIAIVGDFLRCSSRLIKGKGNLVPRVFSISNMAAAGEQRRPSSLMPPPFGKREDPGDEVEMCVSGVLFTWN